MKQGGLFSIAIILLLVGMCSGSTQFQIHGFPLVRAFFQQLGAEFDDIVMLEDAGKLTQEKIDNMFKYGFSENTIKEFSTKVQELKFHVVYMESKYLNKIKNLNNVVVGSGSTVFGNKNRVFANDSTVEGNMNYILYDTPGFSSEPLQGTGWIRIGKYDVNLNKLKLKFTVQNLTKVIIHKNIKSVKQIRSQS